MSSLLSWSYLPWSSVFLPSVAGDIGDEDHASRHLAHRTQNRVTFTAQAMEEATYTGREGEQAMYTVQVTGEEVTYIGRPGEGQEGMSTDQEVEATYTPEEGN